MHLIGAVDGYESPHFPFFQLICVYALFGQNGTELPRVEIVIVAADGTEVATGTLTFSTWGPGETAAGQWYAPLRFETPATHTVRVRCGGRTLLERPLAVRLSRTNAQPPLHEKPPQSS